MACLLVLSSVAPPPSSLAQCAMMRGAMGAIATWIFMPSLLGTLVAGLLAIGVNGAFHQFWLGLAGWAWTKLAAGILVFEGGLVGIKGRMQEEAERSAGALAAQAASISDPAHARAEIGGFIEAIYNRTRLHSALG